MSNKSEKAIIAGTVIAVVSSIPIPLGFGTAGIAASSYAAASQAAIGNVAAGSWFATLTSLGATGVYVKGVVTGAVAAAPGLVVKLHQLIKKKTKKDKLEQEPKA